jgi:hypothetical protein
MAKKRKTIAMNAADFVAGMRDAVSPGTAPDPETHRTPESEAETEQDELGDLMHQRTSFYAELRTKCSWCGSQMRLENVRAGQRVACPKVSCNGGVTIGPRPVRHHTDVDVLPESVQLPAELAAALQTDRPTLAGWLERALSAEEAKALGHAFGVLISHNHRLGKRVEELEHHLDLLAGELRTQMGAARGLEAALTRIQRCTCLPVDPDVWPSG